jgi:hypothetical protein
MKANESGSAGDENRHEALTEEEAPRGAEGLLINHACFMFCFRS